MSSVSKTEGKEPEFRGNPSVAALIAARETRDVVSTSFSRNAERRTANAHASPTTHALKPRSLV